MYKYLLMCSKTALVIYQCELIHTNTCSKNSLPCFKISAQFFREIDFTRFSSEKYVICCFSGGSIPCVVDMISAFFLTLNSFHRKRFALYSSASRRFHSYDVKKSNFFRKNYFKFSWILKKIQKDTFPYKLTLFDYFSFHCSHDPHIQIQLFFYSIWFLNVKFI